MHHPLAGNDPLAVLGEPALAQEGFEHRSLRLLELQEQRVAVVASKEKEDPGAGADASDTDHLPRRVNVPVALEKLSPIGWQGLRIGVDHAANDPVEVGLLGARQHVLDRRDQGWIADDPQLAVDGSTELGERPDAVLRPRLRQIGLHTPLRPGGHLDREALNDRVCVQARVPDIDVPHHREARHRLAIRARSRQYDRTPRSLVEAEIPSGHREARRQPLHIPLERPRQRLVEIVDAEHQPTVRRGEEPEVGEMRVTAQLRVKARSRAVREVRRHDVGRAAKEGERRHEHSPITNRHQLRKTRPCLLLEQFHRVAANRGGLPRSMRRTRDLSPRSLPPRPPLVRAEATRCRLRFDLRERKLSRQTGTRHRAVHDRDPIKARTTPVRLVAAGHLTVGAVVDADPGASP